MLNVYLTSPLPHAIYMAVFDASPDSADLVVRRAGYDNAIRLDGLDHKAHHDKVWGMLAFTRRVPRGTLLIFTGLDQRPL